MFQTAKLKLSGDPAASVAEGTHQHVIVILIDILEDKAASNLREWRVECEKSQLVSSGPLYKLS